MLVRMLDGHQAGNIIDLRNDVALEHIRQRRAERAFQDPAPEAPRLEANAPPAPVPDAKPKKRKRG